MSAKKSINIDATLARKIPYLRTYEEEGMFEVEPHLYSKAYTLNISNPKAARKMDGKQLTKKFAEFLNMFDEEIHLQFVIYNRLVDQNSYLEKVLLPKTDQEIKGEITSNYNYIIEDNISIGHNNVDKSKYFIISTKKDLPEEAVALFKEIDAEIKEAFMNICEIESEAMSLEDRMRVLHSIYNQNSKEAFGAKADIKNDGVFTINNMRYMKLTTKDIIAPNEFNDHEKTYFVLNKNVYGRSIFVNSVPAIVSDNLITDLTNVSSNMLFSIHYDMINAKDGFEQTAKLVKDNTIITETLDRRTVQSRKNKAILRTEALKKSSEESYFHRVALENFKEAVAKEQKGLLCSFAITLFANSLEELERDTKLLKISASKFVCQLKVLDLQQREGLNACLPLGNCAIHIKRFFTIDKIANVSPLDVQETIKKDGLFMGLNAMNDNLVLLNRKNNPNTNGLISGISFSGKTYQMKRELVNAFIGTKDKIIIISSKENDYTELCKKLGGQYIEDKDNKSIFFTNADYGLAEDKKVFKTTYLKALLSSTRDMTSVKDEKSNLEYIMQWNKEYEDLEDYLWEHDFDIEEPVVLQEMKSRGYGMISQCLEKVLLQKSKTENPISNAQVTLINAPTTTALIETMDQVWNFVIEEKKKNITTWVFIDNIDPLLKEEETSDYLQEYAIKCNQSKTILTIVAQESIKLFNDSHSSYELLLDEMGYIKLLNQAPIERNKYAEVLNIPNGLLSYISDVEPSEGLIITPTSNVAFDDSFVEDKNSGFYALFN